MVTSGMRGVRSKDELNERPGFQLKVLADGIL